MRTLVSSFVVAGISAALTLGVGAAAGASVSAKTDKLCTAVKSLDVKTLGQPTTSASTAGETVRELKKLRRVAKGQAKQALGTLVDAYQQVADGKRPEKVFARTKVVEALSKLSLSVSLCVPIALPDISLPSTSAPRR